MVSSVVKSIFSSFCCFLLWAYPLWLSVIYSWSVVREQAIEMSSAPILAAALTHTQVRLVDYLERISNQVANIGRVPEILDEVRSTNEQQFDLAEFNLRVEEIESEWEGTDPIYSKFQRQLLENPASQFLREFNNVFTAFREIIVTDEHGRLVAASNKSSDYYQADEAWWQRAYLEGQGKRYVSGIQFDESANVYGMEIAQPIRESGGGEVIGIVKVIVDSHEISSLVDSIKLGGDTRALLIAADGSEILGPLRVIGYRFPEGFRISTLEQLSVEATQILALPQEEREVFLGLPQFRIKDLIPDLDWYVVINGAYDEVFAPFQNLNKWFISLVSGYKSHRFNHLKLVLQESCKDLS